MRAFVESTPEIVHAEVNVSEDQSRALVQKHQIRSVPAYRLVDPNTDEVLYKQSGGAPEGQAIRRKIKTWSPEAPAES